MAVPGLRRGKEAQLFYLAMVRLGSRGASGTYTCSDSWRFRALGRGVPAVLTTSSIPLLPLSRTGSVAAMPGEYPSSFFCPSLLSSLYRLLHRNSHLSIPRELTICVCLLLVTLCPASLGYQLIQLPPKATSFSLPLVFSFWCSRLTQLPLGAFTVISVNGLECTLTQFRVPSGRIEQSVLTG